MNACFNRLQFAFFGMTKFSFITKRQFVGLTSLLLILATLGLFTSCSPSKTNEPPLWDAYTHYLKQAKYVDLTHTITPTTPVGAIFGRSTFARATDLKTHRPYDYVPDGFGITSYTLATDQLGTQLDPPAHWSPDYPAIDELPPTFAVRPLVVISIVDQVKQNPAYHLKVADIQNWEKEHGSIPEGSVVFIRSDWSKRWPDSTATHAKLFPGLELAALKFLHLQRHILFHGHEPLDTDTTPTMEGEAWLLRNGYTQAEGVCNLDQVPQTGALVNIGYPKLAGGTGGYARFIAICPPDWQYGVQIDPAKESPFPKQSKSLHWDQKAGMRVR